MQPMNNRQNGRRRGRNNNQRPQGGGQSRGGDSGNRIDNRARGNAAQLLEKYKNLAREAQMSGDRVQLEYYLQFADHYFRVLADSRSRQEEQRPQRQEDRFDDQGGVDEGVPFGFGDEGEMGEPGDEPRETRRDRGQDRDREQGRDLNRNRDEGRDRDQTRSRRDRLERGERRERAEAGGDDRSNADQPTAYEEEREERGAQRNERPARRESSRPRRVPFGASDDDGAPAAIDVAVLPPAIGQPAATEETDAAPPRRRTIRARKPAADEGVAADS